MPVAEATDTLSGIETASSRGFETITFCGKPAPKHDGYNLLISIHVDSEHATAFVHCQTVENVGSHPKPHVRFLADDNCHLHFVNQAVFGISEVQLMKGQEADLDVKVAQGETECSFDGGKTKNPPKIVVP